MLPPYSLIGQLAMEESSQKKSPWPTALAVIVFIALLALLFWPAKNGRGVSPRSTCKNNLKWIGLALLNYEETYGSLPPAYIADEDGKPIHSWRALLLPFLEQDELTALYDFSQPWDSPHNSKLANSMPSVFRCAAADDLPDGYTNYVAITGPGRIFDGARATRLSEVADGASNTLMVIEVPDSQAVPWLSPFATPIAIARSNHGGGGNAVFADGFVQFVKSDLKPETMTALQTIAGGERGLEEY